ncbi:MAG: PfaD family polyunsaturated fatty acid/polyketide biosynthesis protein [Lachnospiraceae bacterium]|nr:PfaD family polyunsaturated fatty acid/polyketide biosynthesis protein [Lachnospiraceae bacterium]
MLKGDNEKMAIVNKENSHKILANKDYPILYVYNINNKLTVSTDILDVDKILFLLPNFDATSLGDASFKKDYNLKYAYYGGAMANGIASSDMVIALGKCGCMGSYGSGGVRLSVIAEEIDKIKSNLTNNEPYMINMLCNRNVEAEMELAKLLVEKDVPAVEASAYITPSEPLVYYRVNGIYKDANGTIVTPHKVIAKVSREEVLTKFAMPPQDEILSSLVNKGLITLQEAELAKLIPMADDITVEADSGGHTDGRPLVSMLPALIALKDKIMAQYNYQKEVRIGAAGGIGTGLSALAAFDMGAAYVVTGSVNQACVEAGTSDYVKQCLEETAMADVAMAPCADMFEDGAKVEVIRKRTMYAQNASKLYELYKKYPSFEAIPEADRTKVEKRILKKSFNEVWEMTKEYFMTINPNQITKAESNPKLKMALVFRWYLGNSSRWAVNGDADRKMDMQIWCGQAMGAFNLWVKGTPLEKRENRCVADVATLIMNSAAIEYMKNLISKLGV